MKTTAILIGALVSPTYSDRFASDHRTGIEAHTLLASMIFAESGIPIHCCYTLYTIVVPEAFMK